MRGVTYTLAGTAPEAEASAGTATEPPAVATEETAPVEVAAPPAETVVESEPVKVIAMSDLESAVGSCESVAPGGLSGCLAREMAARGYVVQEAAAEPAAKVTATEATPAGPATEPAAETAPEAEAVA